MQNRYGIRPENRAGPLPGGKICALTPHGKKITQQRRALFAAHAPHVPQAVIGALGVKLFRAGNNGAGQIVRCTVNKPGQPGMDAGRRAHGARLQGNHQYAAAKPVIAKHLTRAA